MGVRWLEGGMLHIGIDPQEGPSKTEWHLWRRWLRRPALSSRHRKLWHCQLCWENCPRSWRLLSHRYFLYRSTGQRLRGLVSCGGLYTCSVFNMNLERNETQLEWNLLSLPREFALHMQRAHTLKETYSIDNKVSSSCIKLYLLIHF